MASPAGRARLFLDNFDGGGSIAYDFGCPRKQEGDNPHPNPSPSGDCSPPRPDTGVYAGGMTYRGCYTDQLPPTLPFNTDINPSINSVDACTSVCNDAGYKIAGMEFGQECWCGNSLGEAAQGPLIDASCSTACSGTSSLNDSVRF